MSPLLALRRKAKRLGLVWHRNKTPRWSLFDPTTLWRVLTLQNINGRTEAEILRKGVNRFERMKKTKFPNPKGA